MWLKVVGPKKNNLFKGAKGLANRHPFWGVIWTIDIKQLQRKHKDILFGRLGSVLWNFCCYVFLSITSFISARYVFPEFYANPPGNHPKSSTKAFGTTWNCQQSPEFLWSQIPNGTFTRCYWERQFASKWTLWNYLIWLECFNLHCFQNPRGFRGFLKLQGSVGETKVWSEPTALQESRSWVWKLNSLTDFLLEVSPKKVSEVKGIWEIQVEIKWNSRIHPRELAALATGWTQGVGAALRPLCSVVQGPGPKFQQWPFGETKNSNQRRPFCGLFVLLSGHIWF